MQRGHHLERVPRADLTFLIKSRYHEKGPDKGKYKGFDTQGLKFYIGAMALGLQVCATSA